MFFEIRLIRCRMALLEMTFVSEFCTVTSDIPKGPHCLLRHGQVWETEELNQGAKWHPLSQQL